MYHWRCFTRRFIIQLIARFTLPRFLQSFSILLIEACSGFKDEITLFEETNESSPESEEMPNERSDIINAQEADPNLAEVNEMKLFPPSLISSLGERRTTVFQFTLLFSCGKCYLFTIEIRSSTWL